MPVWQPGFLNPTSQPKLSHFVAFFGAIQGDAFGAVSQCCFAGGISNGCGNAHHTFGID